MNSSSRAALLLLATLVSSDARAAARPAGQGDVIPAESGAKGDEAARPADQPLEGWRAELLELAADAAGAIPMRPHVKTRSQAQESVVVLCLELEQPQRALRYGERIENWRRGAVYADYALYCLEHGARAEAADYLQRAEELVQRLQADPDEQQWRPDRIRVKLAAAHLELGDAQRAHALTSDLAPSEAGKLEALRAGEAEPTAVEQQVRFLEAVTAAGDFDRIRNALEGCVALVDRFYAQPQLTTRLTEAMEKAWPKAPRMIHAQLAMRLGEIALEHDDAAEARARLTEAREVLDGARWRPEDHVTVLARLATLRHRVGDAAEARALLLTAEQVYEKEREGISTVFRAGALRPLAEAYRAIGDEALAKETYVRVVQEGAVNVNARPRAEDLVATCLSLARGELPPDPNLLSRLREIRAGLSEPW